MYALLIFSFCVIISGAAADYVMDSQRAELLFLNENVVKDMNFRFAKYNRTIFALNVSYVLLRDFDDGKIMATVSGDQYFHNEYRFSGQKATLNACRLWKANTFHIREQFKNSGWDIDGCNIKKGKYKITNFFFDRKYYPKYMPLGQWRLNVRCHHEDVGDIFIVQWYMELKTAKLT